jgi:hypothetical protein
MLPRAFWWCGVDVGVLYVYNRPVGKPQEKVMMSTAASLPSVVKPRFMEKEPNFRRSMPASFATTPDNGAMNLSKV